ncbi:DUF882 domain-containing protein [Hansschlegelia plantiphila]|uniref:Murein endopeptidase K n=1 Tax=Hansschlegelia plantiphila TaxID=374655 RepID=A0A9W6MVA7_9HYPH|nr:DUF882 domain-containing protein [Hansschlegelia plantiphila]GLK67753.1 hypothetical protein GCM10008179_13910 [Hansschlegelia plantiphila]
MGSEATENAQANGDTRSLTLYHTHRGDTTTITFKRDGRYDAEGLKQLSYFLRDWRNDKQTRMEPRLFDIVWEVHRQVGRGGMINIVSSYRSPETNAYLRSHSQGVAKFSQHMLGRAMDFYITGVPVSAVREAGMRLQRGGVGFYPTSGRPFVHLDAGNVRAWPRMTRTQLVKLFPDGKTVHVPADGKPLPGYQVAMAELKARGSVSVQDAYASRSTGKGFFARLFGGGDEGDDAETVVASAAPARAAASSAPSRGGDDEESTAAIPATKVATIRVPVPMARPSDMIRSAPAEVAVAAASIPLPPVGPARAAVEAPMQVAAANIPLPPVAPAVVAAKPVPLPPSAPAYELASIETPPAADAGPDMVWQAGAQPVGQNPTSAGLAAASNVPTPRPRPTESAVAVLAALPAPSSAEGSSSRLRKIDPQVASAYQAEAGTFPRLPDAFTSKKSASAGEMRMAYADPQIELPSTSPASTRPAVAPQTRVSATAPTDPNVRVLSPYATPAAVYAAAAAPQKRRATLSAPEGMVTARMDTTTLRAAASPVPAARQAVMVHPDQFHVASLMVAPNAALVGGFNGDPTHGARTDRFSGSSVMLLRTQSFMPAAAYASASSHG